ncbi:MAG: hypothetical protein ACR2OD_07215, partial [Gaiellaceae bacterium]
MIDSFVSDAARPDRRWLFAALVAVVAAMALALAPSSALGADGEADANEEAAAVVEPQPPAPPPPPPPRPEVEKESYGKWVKSIDWDIHKKVIDRYGKHVDEASWKLFYGDSLWASYVIGLQKKVAHKYSVHSKITIPLGKMRNGASDGPIKIEDYMVIGDKKIPVTDIRCEGYDGVPETVVYEGELVCESWVYVPTAEHGVNYVKVWIGHDDTKSAPTATAYGDPYEAEAEFWFGDKPDKVEGYRYVSIKDASWDGGAIKGPYDGKQTRFAYDYPFECKGNESEYWHTNTAQLVAHNKRDTGRYKVIKEASARLHIQCYGLEVKKTAKTKFDRTYKWKIAKYASHDKIDLTHVKGAPKKGDPKADPKSDPKADAKKRDLKTAATDPKRSDPKADAKKGDPKGDAKSGKKPAPRDSVTVKYGVEVDAYHRDDNFRAYGKIEVTNTHPKLPAHIVDLKDVIVRKDGKADSKAYARVWCEGGKKGDKLSLPIHLGPGETLVCRWESDLPDGKERKNIAKVKLQNHHYKVVQKPNPGWYVEATKQGMKWFSGYAPIKHGEPKKVVDAKAKVYDRLAPKGVLGRVYAKDVKGGPKKFHYEVHVRPGHLAPDCGKGSLYNKAALETYDTKTRIEDSVSIPIHVECIVPKQDPPKSDPPKKDTPPASDKKDPPPADDKKGDHGKKDEVIVCTPGKGKPWHLMGPKGKKSDFFESGKSYKQVMKKGRRGKSP